MYKSVIKAIKSALSIFASYDNIGSITPIIELTKKIFYLTELLEKDLATAIKESADKEIILDYVTSLKMHIVNIATNLPNYEIPNVFDSDILLSVQYLDLLNNKLEECQEFNQTWYQGLSETDLLSVTKITSTTSNEEFQTIKNTFLTNLAICKTPKDIAEILLSHPTNGQYVNISMLNVDIQKHVLSKIELLIRSHINPLFPIANILMEESIKYNNLWLIYLIYQVPSLHRLIINFILFAIENNVPEQFLKYLFKLKHESPKQLAFSTDITFSDMLILIRAILERKDLSKTAKIFILKDFAVEAVCTGINKLILEDFFFSLILNAQDPDLIEALIPTSCVNSQLGDRTLITFTLDRRDFPHDTSIMQALAKIGADIESTNKNGQSLLFYLFKKAREFKDRKKDFDKIIEIINQLITQGIKINAVKAAQNNLIHIANSPEEIPELIQILKSHNAYPPSMDGAGYSSLSPEIILNIHKKVWEQADSIQELINSVEAFFDLEKLNPQEQSEITHIKKFLKQLIAYKINYYTDKKQLHTFIEKNIGSYFWVEVLCAAENFKNFNVFQLFINEAGSLQNIQPFKIVLYAYIEKNGDIDDLYNTIFTKLVKYLIGDKENNNRRYYLKLMMLSIYSAAAPINGVHGFCAVDLVKTIQKATYEDYLFFIYSFPRLGLKTSLVNELFLGQLSFELTWCEPEALKIIEHLSRNLTDISFLEQFLEARFEIPIMNPGREVYSAIANIFRNLSIKLDSTEDFDAQLGVRLANFGIKLATASSDKNLLKFFEMKLFSYLAISWQQSETVAALVAAVDKFFESDKEQRFKKDASNILGNYITDLVVSKSQKSDFCDSYLEIFIYKMREEDYFWIKILSQSPHIIKLLSNIMPLMSLVDDKVLEIIIAAITENFNVNNLIYDLFSDLCLFAKSNKTLRKSYMRVLNYLYEIGFGVGGMDADVYQDMLGFITRCCRYNQFINIIKAIHLPTYFMPDLANAFINANNIDFLDSNVDGVKSTSKCIDKLRILDYVSIHLQFKTESLSRFISKLTPLLNGMEQEKYVRVANILANIYRNLLVPGNADEDKLKQQVINLGASAANAAKSRKLIAFFNEAVSTNNSIKLIIQYNNEFLKQLDALINLNKSNKISPKIKSIITDFYRFGIENTALFPAVLFEKWLEERTAMREDTLEILHHNNEGLSLFKLNFGQMLEDYVDNFEIENNNQNVFYQLVG